MFKKRWQLQFYLFACLLADRLFENTGLTFIGEASITNKPLSNSAPHDHGGANYRRRELLPINQPGHLGLTHKESPTLPYAKRAVKYLPL
jgi:hypothetical protein